MNWDIVRTLLLGVMIIIGMCFLPSTTHQKLEEIITKLKKIETRLQSIEEIFKGIEE